ncbi:MAG: hypothetical protein ACE5JH_12140 [Acidobacteriota bacterium]
MSRATRGIVRAVVSGTLVLALLLSVTSTLAKRSRPADRRLFIVADRVVGFVPFTVYVYGRIIDAEPARIELCRSEVASLVGESRGEPSFRGPGDGAEPARFAGPRTSCAPGRIEGTQEGYEYTHDMHFDRPGTYRLRLRMVDRDGRRVVSNAIQVRAL